MNLERACRDRPIGWWFDDDEFSDDSLKAKGLCMACPVIDLCLERELQHEERQRERYGPDAQVYRYGIRGGMSASERHLMAAEVEQMAAASDEVLPPQVTIAD